MGSLTATEVEIAVEPLAALLRDGKELFQRHWQEGGLDQDKINLSLDEDTYTQLDSSGNLHVLTVRADGRLVGYYVAFLMVHPHYKTAGLMATTDVYYLEPEFRGMGTGARLFKEAERTLKERGVVKVYLSCKVHQDHSRLFKSLGWAPSDLVFTKYIG